MSHDSTRRIRYRTQQVGDVEVFYREAGRKDAPVLLLLHGFPSASHMFRDLIPLLASQYRLIAPDLPGFGMTKAPPRGQFDYTFDALYKVIEGLTDALGLTRYSLYLFDYGAPVGFRLAAAHPERVSAIISQNGNAYLEGFSDQWDAWQAYWREPSAANREACRASLSPQTIREWQYGTGVAPGTLSPDGYTLDIAYMACPGAEEIQLDLILDYRSNVAAYPSVFPRPSAAAAGRVGQARPSLYPGRRAGLPQGSAKGRSAPIGYGSLRLGDACGGDCALHQ